MATILVVDDMAIFRDPMAAMLKLAGHSTLVAVNGQEALGILETTPVDLVLLDLAMPVMDGITFLDRLRAHPQRARTPVILLTAVTDRGRIIEAVKLGVRECLLKSQFSSKELLARVQKLLEKTQPSGVQPLGAQTPGVQPSGVQPSGVQPPGAQPPGVQRPGAQPSSAPLAGAKPAGAKPPGARQPAPAATPAPARASRPGAPAGAAAQASPNDGDGSVPRLLTRTQSLARAEKSMEVTTLSGVAAEVVSLAGSPQSDLSSLALMISRDAVLAAKVLRVANSAAYANKGSTVVDISDAIKRIGWAAVRNIAATVGIYDSMPASAAGSERDFMRCWQHSLAVAQLCEQLTEQSKSPENSGVAYLVGLCHDLAEILLCGHFQSEYSQVLECERRTGRSRNDLERQMLGVTHHDLTVLILGRIGLPEKISAPIRALHDPNHADPASTSQMTKVLKLADAYADGLMLGSQKNCCLTAFTRDECKSAIGAENPSTVEADRFRADILAQTLVLARLPHSLERDLTTPVFPRAKTRVLLVRDTALSAFDPFSTFVQATADVRVQERLPSIPEAANVDCVVALSKTTGGTAFSVDDLTKLAAMKPCFWAVSKIDGAVPASCPVQPRTCPVGAVELASFVSAHAGRAGKAAA